MAIKFNNTDALLPARMRLIPKSPDATLTTVNPEDQSLFSPIGDGSFGICIGPQTLMSCAGATTYVTAPFDLWYGFNESECINLGIPYNPISWDIEVNGQTIGKASVHEADNAYVEDIFNDEVLGIAGDWTSQVDDMSDYANPDKLYGGLYSSTSNEPKRVRFIPSSNYFNNPDFIYAIGLPIDGSHSGYGFYIREDFIQGNNPTLDIDRDTGIVSFCIEGVFEYPKISCAGATNTLVVGLNGMRENDYFQIMNEDGAIILGGTRDVIINDTAYIQEQGFTIDTSNIDSSGSQWNGSFSIVNTTGADARLSIEATRMYIDEELSTPAVAYKDGTPTFMSADVCLGTEGSSGNGEFSCAGATNTVVLGMITGGGYYDINIDGQAINGVYGFRDGYRLGEQDLSTVFAEHGIEALPLDESLNPIVPDNEGYLVGIYAMRVTNQNGDTVRVILNPADANNIENTYQENIYGSNASVGYTDRNGIQFCLSGGSAPVQEEYLPVNSVRIFVGGDN